MLYYVYILHNVKHNKIYIGFTSDLRARISSHNELGTKGWIIKFRPWKVVHTETFKTKRGALRREKELKSATGRQFIRREILHQNVISSW